VGVIINLALFFAYHTLWPEGLEGSFEWPALVLGIVAFVALIRFRIGVITLILLAGVAGACIQWLL